MQAFVRGTTRQRISRKNLGMLRLSVPALSSQLRVARRVDEFETLRLSASAHLAHSRRSTERFRQAVLAAACAGRLTADWRSTQMGRYPGGTELADAARRERRRESSRFVEPKMNDHIEPGELPETWTEVPLGLLLTEIKYGTSQRSEYGGSGVPVLRIPNVSGDRLDVADLKFASLKEAEAASLRLQDADLLMIRSNGSPQLVGKTELVSGPAVGMTYAGYLMRLRADRAAVDPAFLAMALRGPRLRHQVEMPLRSTSGVNNINTQEVRGLVVPLPPLEEQAEIVRRVDRLMSLAEAIADRLGSASRRVGRSSQAVLAKAFCGELIS
jgi:type I restriction enzyme, S subunit